MDPERIYPISLVEFWSDESKDLRTNLLEKVLYTGQGTTPSDFPKRFDFRAISRTITYGTDSDLLEKLCEKAPKRAVLAVDYKVLLLHSQQMPFLAVVSATFICLK